MLLHKAFIYFFLLVNSHAKYPHAPCCVFTVAGPTQRQTEPFCDSRNNISPGIDLEKRLPIMAWLRTGSGRKPPSTSVAVCIMGPELERAPGRVEQLGWVRHLVHVFGMGNSFNRSSLEAGLASCC